MSKGRRKEKQKERENQRRKTKKIQSKTKSKKKTNKQTNKQSHLVHSIKEMNGGGEGGIKAIQKENEIRKAVIRTQRWRLRIKLQKENTDKITNRTRGKHLQ